MRAVAVRPQLARHSARLRGTASARGFTLVELAAVCAIACVLLAVAWPSLKPTWLRAGRADAVQALTQLQLAQARHHALHGLYARELHALAPTVSTSPQGLYALALDEVQGDSYTASATALPGSRQAGDGSCARLTLQVQRGFASLGPSASCWQR